MFLNMNPTQPMFPVVPTQNIVSPSLPPATTPLFDLLQQMPQGRLLHYLL